MIPKFISDKLNQLVLFDMDGVLAEYIAGEELLIESETKGIYLNKRPIKSVLSVAEQLNEMVNVEVGVLSSCDFPSQVLEKKEWLCKYLPFIKDENIHIVVWTNEKYTKETRCVAKLDKIKKMSGFDNIFMSIFN